MIVKTILSTWMIEEGHRLDCGPFVKGSIEARKTIEGLRYPKEHLVDLTRDGINGIYHVGQEKIIWAEDEIHGMPFLRSADIIKADLSHQPFISRKQVSCNQMFQCPAGATLITRSGTIGRMAYMRIDMEDTAISQDVLKVVSDENRVKSGYLYAFLNSKYGIPIITGGTFGSIIVHIEAENIANLPVPRLGAIEDQAHELVQKAAELRVQAVSQIQKATKHYLEASGLKDISPSKWVKQSGRIGFSATIKKTILRAVNYIPFNQKLEEEIKSKSLSWKPLGEITEPGTFRSGLRFKRVDSEPEFGVELIGQREIANLVPKGRWIARNQLPNDKLIFVPEGTIMVNAQGGLKESDSFARVQYISGKRLSYAYSQHFFRVIADEQQVPRGALFAYLRSNLAFRLLRSCVIGSMQQDFHPELIRELPVPIINHPQANAIDTIIRNAYHAYDDAIDCEDRARNLVECAIEEGGYQ